MKSSRFLAFTEHVFDITCGSCRNVFELKMASRGDPDPETYTNEERDIKCTACGAIVRVCIEVRDHRYSASMIRTFAA